jgi:hypothetical protein
MPATQLGETTPDGRQKNVTQIFSYVLIVYHYYFVFNFYPSTVHSSLTVRMLPDSFYGRG